jgi:tetratricopeptide (TPR) repeat protein/CHAT domain-containing protein
MQRHVIGCSLVIVFVALLRAGLAAGSSQQDQAKLSSLQQKIDELDHAGKYRDAVPVAEERLKLVESTNGTDSLETAAICNKLGELYRKNGEYAKAKPLCDRGLKIREKALGPDDPHTAESLNNLALLYVATGDPKTAEPLGERALKIREEALGPDHPDTAQSLNTLALATSDDAKAKVLFERALKIREKALGPNHPETAKSLGQLGNLYRDMGDHTKAQPLLQRALAITEKELGPDHPETASNLNYLGNLYEEQGDYAKAEPLYQRAIRIDESSLGHDHPDTATSLNNLANLYTGTNDYAKAEPLYQRALKINERVLGAHHPDTARNLFFLGHLYWKMGDYAKAEMLYQRALKIREKVLGPNHLDTAGSLNNLAALYQSMGDYAKAEPLYQRTLNLYEHAFGPDHINTAMSLNNLAVLHMFMGDYTKAEPLYQRALKIAEKVLGADHPHVAICLNNLAFLYTSTGDYAKAEPLYERAVKIDEKALGPENAETATNLNNLAELYQAMGNFEKAEALYQRALTINEKARGPYHPRTTKTLHNLGDLMLDTGRTKDALGFADRGGRAEEKNLSDILSFTSEQQRLEFQKIAHPYDLAGTLGNGSSLAQTVLRQKGVVLDSLLEDRLVAEASGDPKQRVIVDELRSAKQRLNKLQLEVPRDLSEQARQQRDAEKGKLSTEVEQLEAGLARQVAGLGRARRALSVTVEQVQAVLPKQAALIELLHYSHYLGKRKSEPRYGAIVIGASGKPTWVPVGNAAEIEKNVALYQKSVRGKTDEATLSSVLKALNNQVWAPIEKALPADTTTVIVSPDTELSFVSFATLLTADGRFVGEKYSVRYVASGRDLLRETKPTAGPKTTMRVFANPDFGGIAAAQHVDQKNVVALRSVEMRDLQGISLPSLPGTEKEAAELEARAKKSNLQPQTYLGPKATKAELRKVNSPRILHLATHGFFLPEIDLGTPKSAGGAAEIPKGKLVNPMHRSGLALAGAQRTLQAWAKGEVPPIENDGIVTAEDVGGLKLDSTWLVVLSACDTGGGEARAGEDVMGLRRGFVQAGAQNLLMTLWPISDETTVHIMLDFYDAAFKSSNAPQALADTQRDWLVKLRKQRGLLEAVRLAGPFIMSSQGKP